MDLKYSRESEGGREGGEEYSKLNNKEIVQVLIIWKQQRERASGCDIRTDIIVLTFSDGQQIKQRIILFFFTFLLFFILL